MTVAVVVVVAVLIALALALVVVVIVVVGTAAATVVGEHSIGVWKAGTVPTLTLLEAGWGSGDWKIVRLLFLRDFFCCFPSLATTASSIVSTFTIFAGGRYASVPPTTLLPQYW